MSTLAQTTASRPTYRVGIDVGGTFTDAIAIESGSGAVTSVKVPTTPADQSEGVLAAIMALEMPIEQIDSIVHGFTVTVNAFITRGGVRTGLLATHGHRDILEIGRVQKDYAGLYDPTWRRALQERPIVERRHRRGVHERILADGTVAVPLDERHVREEVEFLRSEGVESIAVAFLNSYVNPEHELRAVELVRETFPEAYVCSSSEINPVAREYERTVTAAIGAYTGPLAQRYLRRLEARLKDAAYRGSVNILQISGGSQTLAAAVEEPIHAFGSGPVGGVIGAQAWGERNGCPDLITLDMGGTTTDLSIIRGGEATVVNEADVEPQVTLLLPQVEVRSIGAGGGSVLSIDRAGGLRLGPESAGAHPGPACYGRGGTKPALTDAYVAMGLLQPDYFLGGEMHLDREASLRAFDELTDRLAMGVESVAEMYFELATLQSAEAIRELSAYRGFDPRDFTLFCYGSAGAMHAAATARALGMSEAVIAQNSGAYSAFGLVGAPMRVDHSVSPMVVLDQVSASEFDARVRELERRGTDELWSQGVERERIEFERVCFGMYQGQTWENRLVLPGGTFDDDAMRVIAQRFHETFLRNYGYKAEELPIVVTTLIVSAVARREASTGPRGETSRDSAAQAITDRRRVFFQGCFHNDLPFYDRDRLGIGDTVDGPAIVNDPTTTVVVGTGDTLRVDAEHNLRISIGSAPSSQHGRVGMATSGGNAR